MAKIFAQCNEDIFSSYLIEITAKILDRKDDVTGEGYVVDYILDKTGMKGTGRWTVQEAAEQSIAAPTIDVALDQRYMSARKEELVKASAILKGPSKIPSTSRDQIIKDLEASLYASKIVSYAQGLGIIKAASDKYEWNVNRTECARLWKGGCIIRAKLLDDIQAAQARDKDLPNLSLIVNSHKL